METTLRQPEVAGFPAELLKDADKSAIDHGPYYIYTCGESIHRVHIGDGTDHLWAGTVTCVMSGGRYVDQTTAARNAVIRQTRKISISGDQEQYFLNAFMASSKTDTIYNENRHRGAVWCRAFDKIMPVTLKLEELNKLISLPVGCDREDFPGWMTPVVPPDITKLIEEQGVLGVRMAHLQKVYQQLLAGPQDEVTRVWLAGIQEMLQGFEVARRTALQGLQTSDREIKAQRKDVWDPCDERWMKLTGWKPEKRSGDQTVTVKVDQQGTPATVTDVEREQCYGCGEMVAVSRKRCRYCGEPKPEPDAAASIEQAETTAPLRRKLERRPTVSDGVQD